MVNLFVPKINSIQLILRTFLLSYNLVKKFKWNVLDVHVEQDPDRNVNVWVKLI